MDTTQQLHQLLNDEWEARLRADPLFATYTGDNRYNDRLPEISESAMQRWGEQLAGFQQRQQAIDPAGLSEADRLNLALFGRYLEDELGMLRYHNYRMPIAKAFGFHLYFPELHLNMPMNTLADYEAFIARLRAFPDYAAGHIELLRAGLKDGQVLPRVAVESIPEALRPHTAADPARSPLYQAFSQFPAAVPAGEHARLTQAGAAALREAVAPGYAQMLCFLEEEYIPAARQTIAAHDLPEGAAYYRHCIRYHTTLDLTPEQIHQTGQDEVRRIRTEMEAVIRQVGFKGDLKAFIHFLRTDPRFYVTTPAALLKETALVLKKMDGELPRLFKTLPRLPYGIRAIPDFSAPGNTAAYYQPGAGDGSRAGYYYVNTYDLPSRPTYEIEALSLHEAVPGHHLQIALQQELELPNFRRFASFTAYVEGWALYAERLGLETGFYQDPYSNFGRLSYEMWRACRLVVDTGLHALGWSRQQAIDFMAANTSSTLLNITNEVDRYIAWPGQALAYKLGELKIRALRQQAEQALGPRFDLRQFHDLLLLAGPMPLAILEQRVKAYIKAK
jgi:uncharacterized protein (DUF885 family)